MSEVNDEVVKARERLEAKLADSLPDEAKRVMILVQSYADQISLQRIKWELRDAAWYFEDRFYDGTMPNKIDVSDVIIILNERANDI